MLLVCMYVLEEVMVLTAMDKIKNIRNTRASSSSSVGFWPIDRMTPNNSFVEIVPLPSLSNSSKASLNSALSSSSRLLVISASDHLDRPPILTNTTSQVHYMGSSILARLCFAGRQCWAEVVDIFTSAAGNTGLPM